MKDFSFCIPTRFVVGKNSASQVGELIRQYGGRKVLIVEDGGSYLSALLENVRASIKGAGLEAVQTPFKAVSPRLSIVMENVRLCKEEGIDFILAVGGGTVMDTAKAIAFFCENDGDLTEYVQYRKASPKCAKVASIVTLSGTGSEVSATAMIIDDRSVPEIKYPLFQESIRFLFSVMDPSLTCTLPMRTTIAGAFDAITHIMEHYFCGPSGYDLQDRMCEAVISSIMANMRAVRENPSDYGTRAQLQMGATLANSTLLGVGCDSDWAVHYMENPVTTMTHNLHGSTLAIISVAWMRYCFRRDLRKAVNFAVLCGHNALCAAYPDIEDQCAALDKMLAAGCPGLSSGLLYAPGRTVPPSDLLRLAAVLKPTDAIYTTHLRSEGARLIESLEEAISFASAGSGRLHVSHFKTAGDANWGKLDAALELLEKARERGLRVTADRYPYTYSQTSLSVILPPRYDSMRDREIQEKLSGDPAESERLIAELADSRRVKRAILTAVSKPEFLPRMRHPRRNALRRSVRGHGPAGRRCAGDGGVRGDVAGQSAADSGGIVGVLRHGRERASAGRIARARPSSFVRVVPALPETDGGAGRPAGSRPPRDVVPRLSVPPEEPRIDQTRLLCRFDRVRSCETRLQGGFRASAHARRGYHSRVRERRTDRQRKTRRPRADVTFFFLRKRKTRSNPKN